MNKTLFVLGGEGMTNIHPNIDFIYSSDDTWKFEMDNFDFVHYLSKHDLYVHPETDMLIDRKDGYVYGWVI